MPCPVLRRTNPGRAVEAYAAIKAAKYVDETNFVPFIVETGGNINRRAHLFLDVSPLKLSTRYVRTYGTCALVLASSPSIRVRSP